MLSVVGSRRLAQVQQEHRGGFEGIVEDVVDLRLELGGLERIAAFVDQQRLRVLLGFRVGGEGGEGGGGERPAAPAVQDPMKLRRSMRKIP